MEVEPIIHVPYDRTAVPVKPALKKTGTSLAQRKSAAAAANESETLTWDEAVIEEHDLLRGTRMKIEEPKTPFHYEKEEDEEEEYHHHHHHHRNENDLEPGSSTAGRSTIGTNEFGSPSAGSASGSGSGSGLGDLQWDHLERKLHSVAAVREAYPHRHQHDEEEDKSGGAGAGAPLTDEERKALEFKEHRKRHYNEMELVRQFRAQQAAHDDEDDEEDE
jgi:protein phosphatase inhibitor 2